MNDFLPADVTTAASDRASILMLINTFDMGGAERVYVELARGLRARGFRVIAACLQVRSGRVAHELRGTGVDIVNLAAVHRTPAVVMRLAGLLRRERIDVVYTFLIQSHVIGRVAARIARVPVIISSQQIMGWEGLFWRTVNRLTARWCTAVIAVSNSVRDYVVQHIGVSDRKVVTIHNSVDLSRFSNPVACRSQFGQVIGSVARLNPEKDHTTLLRAFAIVRGRHASARLVLAGAGPERGRLQLLADELGIGEAVEFLGEVVDVSAVYRQLNVYVQASHVEGFSLSILEAQASGLPVVAAAVGGNAEAVIDGETGILVPPRDAGRMASGICELLENPEAARALGARGRIRVAECFSAGAMVAATETLVLELLQRSRTGSCP